MPNLYGALVLISIDSELGSTPANDTFYSDTGLYEGTYCYRVLAFNASGESFYSNEVTASTPLQAPSGLEATAVSASRIKLSWTDNSTNETGFNIERKTGANGTYSLIASTGENESAYLDTGLSAATVYYYRIRAFNGNRRSPYSNEKYAQTLGEVGGGPCFVATAAYGSNLAPEVEVLRGFRDSYLLTNRSGRLLVGFYYRYSPPLANYISEHHYIKLLARLALTPIVYGIKYPALALLALVPVAMVYCRRRYIRTSGRRHHGDKNL